MQGTETVVAAGRIGPYKLRGELGRGGMAIVWRAWDPDLEREVALKEPLTDPRLPEATARELGERFVAEARAAARLSHPGIVTVYAAGVWDGRPAIAMELVEGKTLADRLAHGPLSEAEAIGVLSQLLDAVGYAHQHGVVHRDIKPENIFITAEGTVKLADFGVAHVDREGTTRLTSVGSVLGTPGYLSPEQAKGAPVDPRSDLFSVGVVAYEAISGTNPFGPAADTATLLYRTVNEPAPELAKVVPGLDQRIAAAVMAALAKDPADRPQSSQEFVDMLAGQRRAQRQRTRPTLAPYFVVAAVALVALVLMVANALGGVSGGGSSSQVAATEQTQDAATDADSDTDTVTEQAQDEAADDTVVPTRASLSEYSWEELAAIAGLIEEAQSSSDAHDIALKYHLIESDGSFGTATKDLTTTEGKVVHMRLIGIWHDKADTSSGRAGLTFMSDGVVYTRGMTSDKVVEGGWESSPIRSWLNGPFLETLPDEVTKAIKPVYKSTDNSIEIHTTSTVTETLDTLWLPSVVELSGPVDWTYQTEPEKSDLHNEIYNMEGTQYELFSQVGVGCSGSNYTLSLGGDWWLRSVAATAARLGRARYVNVDGDVSLYSRANEDKGVVLCFSL